MQGVSPASPTNLSEARKGRRSDKNSITKQEIYKSEQSNDKDIILFPEGSDFDLYSEENIAEIEWKLNHRPNTTLTSEVVALPFRIQQTLVNNLSKYQYQELICSLPSGVTDMMKKINKLGADGIPQKGNHQVTLIL